MTTTELTSLMGVRAEQLAYLILTRRDDLEVTTNQRFGDLGIDLAATVLENGKATGRLFAVQVKGIRSDAALRSFKTRDFNVDNVTFPLALFVFNMETDEGFWRWLVEPVADSSGRSSTVQVSKDRSLQPLNNDAVALIVEEIRRFYDRRLAHVK